MVCSYIFQSTFLTQKGEWAMTDLLRATGMAGGVAESDGKFYIKILYLFIFNSAPPVLGAGSKSWAC